jgi:DNA (cytosine-5)-methyltransferase 1
MLVLSLFPGIDLLGRGFEAEGFCVVRGPDLIWGGDVRDFHPDPRKFGGVIAGSPCQDFSKLRRSAPTGTGRAMLDEFCRVVAEAQPAWFLLENVPTVPDVAVVGYEVQRLDLNARECGAKQNRPRHFQFGSRDGRVLVPARVITTHSESQPTVLASEGKRKSRRGWPEFCELQGLPGDFALPGMTLSARYRAVGNGVHIDVARTLARAVREALRRRKSPRLCVCNCGRIVMGKGGAATAACRKRLERRRKRDLPGVTVPGTVTVDETQLDVIDGSLERSHGV